ncbi:MAG: thiamine pyrophosphate-dependent enzyme [bacterium]|nr:thiamine pyrophosphate-dependent enzyme [bacterium]
MTETALVQADQKYKIVILEDYRIAYQSRLTSLLGRKEVLTGKAKFGIFGDGKELPQIAMAKAFRKGDFRSGYYRDQTFMMASGLLNIQEFFAQLYANTDVNAEPASAGRMMNGHYGTRSLDEHGQWKELKNLKNSSSDISPTAAQMLRLVGLAHASKYYRQHKDLIGTNAFSVNGNEVAWGTIGNASTSEGHFFEAINAGGVLQVPMVVSVWDDSYGISVHAKYQTTKENISEILKGFQRDEKGEGYQIFTVKGWDYPALCAVYEEAGKLSREKHIPCLVHVTELTQPQGHSTSGSHERYKSKERLAWELENDCLKRFKEWILKNNISTESELEQIENDAKILVNVSKKNAWESYLNPIKQEIAESCNLLNNLAEQTSKGDEIAALAQELSSIAEPIRKEIGVAIHKALRLTFSEKTDARRNLESWKSTFEKNNFDRYNSYLHSESSLGALKVVEVKPIFNEGSKMVDGREVLVAYFDQLFSKDPRVMAFGEDVGKIGDVNQGFAGLQEKHGEGRIFDTGIRELTIVGQGIGTAMRGLRPIAEIQYLDYLLYALQPLSDDVATLQYRTKGGQKAPLIIRTRGHRLEGIWHSGSPMGMILNSLRGMLVLTPRNMVQAAGMYQTLIQSDEPALIIECLNGYRLKERMPENLGEYTIPLGIPEIIEEGSDVTVVSYGSTLRVVQEASKMLKEVGILIEIIDVQTLLPFDINHLISESLKKTNKLVVIDEDVPGGASAFILQQILEQQDGYHHLDAKPITLTAKAHRPAYGTDGDYFSKPNAEEMYDAIFNLMLAYNPNRF